MKSSLLTPFPLTALNYDSTATKTLNTLNNESC
jgi:hypothetical protein